MHARSSYRQDANVWTRELMDITTSCKLSKIPYPEWQWDQTKLVIFTCNLHAISVNNNSVQSDVFRLVGRAKLINIYDLISSQ